MSKDLEFASGRARPFIIWTLCRTGGTNLATALFARAPFPDAQHEPFNRDRQYGPIVAQWLKTENQLQLNYELDKICREGTTIKHCLETVPQPVTNALIESAIKHDYRHVFLYRKEPLGRLLSLHFARATGIWGPQSQITPVADVLPIEQTPLAVDELAEHERSCVKQLEAAWAKLRAAGQSPIVVAFEELYEAKDMTSAQQTVIQILEFLGIDGELEDDRVFARGLITGGDQGTRSKYLTIPKVNELSAALKSVPRFRGGQQKEADDMPNVSVDSTTWQEHSTEEVEFWTKWISSSGSKWPEDYKRRVTGQFPVPPFIEDELSRSGAVIGSDVRILDVGSGPLSYLCGVSEKYKIDLTAIDPLADEYNKIIDDHSITPPVRVRRGYVEELGSLFAPNQFDLVWCCNALDHAIDPIVGLLSLLRVSKPQGCLLLLFHPNEAAGSRYSGLHQWNFDLVDGHYIIERLDQRVNVTELVRPACNIEAQKMKGKAGEKDRIRVRLQKKADINLTQLLMK